MDDDSVFCNLCGEDLRSRLEAQSSPTPAPAPEPVRPTPDQPQESPRPQYQPKGGVKYGTFIPRFFAWLIDLIIYGFISLIFFSERPNILIIAVYLIGLLYFWLFDAFNKGQTLGKKIFGLRAVSEETFEPASAGKALLNNLTKSSLILLFLNPIIGIIFILDFIIGILVNSGNTGNKIRLTQNIAKTVVIKTK